MTSQNELPVVVYLGGFHTLLVGTLIEGSGLDKVIKTIYGDSSFASMLHDKAVARSIRAHILTESALTIILIKYLLPTNNDMYLENSVRNGLDSSNMLNDVEGI